LGGVPPKANGKPAPSPRGVGVPRLQVSAYLPTETAAIEKPAFLCHGVLSDGKPTFGRFLVLKITKNEQGADFIAK